MKRKVLFIISNLHTGGVSKSITSLLNVIDRERYDVALMVVSPIGPFMQLLPPGLRLVTNPIWSSLTDRLGGSWRLLKTGHPLLALGNTARLGVSLVNKAMAGRMIAALMPALEEEFDAVIDFNGQQQLYFMVDKILAKKKITFFHSDYDKWPYYYSADRIYYPKADKIFTISQKCVDSLKRNFPSEASKIELMENISSKVLIEKLAEEDAPELDSTLPSLITVGHVCEAKGIFWAIEAANILKSKGLDFRWYFIGTVDNLKRYADLIADGGITENMRFLGVKINPYPYIRRATIVVHPSKFEGRSIALDEAKIMHKPIVVTNFSTVNDQFTDRHDASICQMSPQSIADAIAELFANANLRQKYISNLKLETKDNTSEIKKLYKAIDD